MKRFLSLFLLLSWSVLIAKLLVLPMRGLPQTFGFTYDDKFMHLILFGGLVYFFMEAVEAFFSIRYWLLVLLSLMISIGYAQFFEYLQQFIPGRTSSIYDTLAGAIGSILAVVIIFFLDYKELRKPKLLLHICCIGCGAYVTQLLQKSYRVTLFFYNPNIFPEKEYALRLEETRKVAKKLGIKLISGKYDHGNWLEKVKGHEQDPERGARCVICYRARLEKTVQLAKRLKFKYFASTLTVSPYKMADAINQIGSELENQYGARFLARDFKKQDGFKKSVDLSKALNLYRQNYCGCEFSLRKETLQCD